MTYGFNSDRSTADVYSTDQVYSKEEIGEGFDAENTVDKKISDIANLLPSTSFDSTNTVNKALTSLSNKIGNVNPLVDGDLQTQVGNLKNAAFVDHGVNPDNLNFDDPATANGSYFVNTSSGGTFPTGSNWGILVVFTAGQGNAAQLMFGNGSLAYRIHVNGEWQNWTNC